MAIAVGEEGPPRRLTSPGLRVIVTDERGRPLKAARLAGWLRRVAPARAAGLVGIAVVSDARSRTLNRAYRAKDYPTDVLSFPAADRTPRGAPAGARRPRRTGRGARVPAPRPAAPLTELFLGEIVIARGVARRQAREAGHPEAIEWRVLALHGLLHLLGYDHERDNGRMLRVETRLRRKGGLREGLISRVGGPR
jgi:probable rRNA maturation factor